MKKNELITKLTEKSGVSKKDTGKICNAITEVIKEVVASDETVQIIGFGTFGVRLRKERIGRNPSTGEEIKIEEAKVPFFKAGKSFKEIVDRK